MRELEREAGDGFVDAEIAIDVFCHRVRKYVGAYSAVMGGLDAIVFTGGIGENSSVVRERICRGLEFLGVKLSTQKNRRSSTSIGTGKTDVLVIHTNEELAIAQDTRRVVAEAKEDAKARASAREGKGLSEE